MRLHPTSLAATLLLSASAVLAATDLETCTRLESSEWAACVQRIDAASLDARDLRVLDDWISEDPGKALNFLGVLDGRLRASDPDRRIDIELRAGLLDGRAEAHRLLGNPEVALVAAMEALRAVPDVRMVEWWTVEGERRWIAPLDGTSGRHTRAARLLLELGRVQEARDLLATALRLGEAGDAESLWAASGGGVVPGLDEKRVPIVAPPWFPELPRAAVALAEGEPFVVSDALGSVLILDFWASWCEPCLKELPALGRLHESEKRNGLQVILINMGEAPEHALRFARGLDLEMPIGIYDEALEDAFDAATLPTVIVADRQGRVRARWEGYGEGIEEKVASLARRLLGTEADPPGERLGQVLKGGDLLRVAWSRVAGGDVDSLAVLPGAGSGISGSIVALAGRQLLSYGSRGAVTRSVDRPGGSGILRQGDLDGDGRDELFGFRPGAKRVVRLQPVTGESETLETSSPTLDLAVAPARGGSPGRLYLATLSGLQRMNDRGEVASLGVERELTGLVSVPGPGGTRLATTSSERGLCFLDPSNPGSERCPGGQFRRVVAGPEGSGVGGVPPGAAAAGGRLFGGRDGEVVLITSTRQVVILDVASGEERFRARLPGLRALALGDLDGDGGDELALAVDNRIVVLEAESAGADPEVVN